MQTAVIMKRKLFDGEISQNSKTEYFSATDLMRAGNKWRINNNLMPMNWNNWYFNTKTQEFVKALEKKYGQVKISARGKGTHTWVHPYLFIELALALSPELKIEVYSWLYDYLVKYRNESGDSYKKMTGALWITCSNKSEYKNEIMDIANRIKKECGVINWETACEEQLKLRDKIHENIALLSDIIRDRNTLIDISIKKAKMK